MPTISHGENAFTRAVIISISLHIAVFILILLSPYLPKSSKKGMVHYVNVISFGGGRGGGGGGLSGGGSSPSNSEEKMTETSVQERESLGDLTTPQNLKTQNPPSMTYPVDKPKREKSSRKPKKTVIKKSSTSKTSKNNTSAKSGEGTGNGSGLRIGVGNGSGGGGSEFAGQIGLSNFPYTYYLQNLHGKVSSNWLTAQIQTGLSGAYHTTVLFKIFRNGRISDPKIIESSGVRTMDLSAIRAVRDASPFPPLPPGYEDEYLQIRLIFEHNK